MTKIQFRGQMSPIMSAVRMGTDSMRISIDIPLTERENALPLLALLDQPLIFEVKVDHSPATTRIERPDDKPEPKAEKPSKGPYGQFWRVMVQKDVKYNPDLQDKLKCSPDFVWDALHSAFETESMSTVSPRQWEAWVTEQGLPESLITMSRQAEVKAVETTSST